MQDWTVEFRRRQKGQHEGDIYCVFVDKDGRQHYTVPHIRIDDLSSQ